MSISESVPELLAMSAEVTDDELIVSLSDGRRLAVPLAWYPRLAEATREQRQHWEMIGPGVGFHWPEIDEDLSVRGLLAGSPAPGVKTRPDLRAV